MFENVNIDWNLSHDDGSTDFSDEETLEDHPRTLNRTPDKKGARPMSIFTPSAADSEEVSPGSHNRSHGSTSDWSRSNTSDSGDSPGSYRNSVMPPPPPPQSKKPSICKFISHFTVSVYCSCLPASLAASCRDDSLTWGFSFCLVAC